MRPVWIALGLVASSCSTVHNEDDELHATIFRFISAVEAKDYLQLREMTYKPISFETDGALVPPVQCAFEGGTGCKADVLSISDMVGDDPVIDVELIGDGWALVDFIPRSNYARYQRGDTRFRSSVFRREFFSCRFVKVEGRWKLSESLCFVESEGPYEDDPGE